MVVPLPVGSVISSFSSSLSKYIYTLHYVMPSSESLDCWFLTLPSLTLAGEPLKGDNCLSLTHLCVFPSGLAPSR